MMKRSKKLLLAGLSAGLLLSTAACGGGKKAFSFTLIYGNNEGAEVAQVAQLVKSQVEKSLGGDVSIKLSTMSKAERLDKMQNDDYEIALTRWGPDYADPMTYLGMWVTNNSNNYGFWSNSNYDAIIDRCTKGDLIGTDKVNDRFDALHDAEKIVMEEAVVAPLYTKASANLIRSGVSGIDYHPVALNRVYKGAAKADGSALNVMLGTNVMSLDTNKATDGDSFEVIADCIDGLYQMDENGTPVPAIASSVDLSADGKTYTFHLRNDAKWQNGDPVTANDFVYAWRRIALGRDEYAYMLDDIGQIKGAAEIIKNNSVTDASTLGVTAVDNYTLKVELENPVSYFLSLMYFPTFYPINQAFCEKVGANYGTSPDTFLGNGAFKLSSYSSGTASIGLVKNNDYYDASKVKLSALNYQVVTDSDTALSAYKNNTLDVVMVSGDQINAAKADASLKDNIKVTGAGYMWYLTFSQTAKNAKGYLANKDLRLAISNSIDRKLIVDTAVCDGSLDTYTAVPPQFAAGKNGVDFSADQNAYKSVCSYNPTKAVEWLNAAKAAIFK